ncbi:MAG: hypothetical protein K2K67_09945, partial [Treponemataceae bacterium]|nr:hypothetical protein [Treponemataceae bacterium]
QDELERVVIPAGVTGVAPGAFAGSGITEIEYKGGLSAWEELVEAGGIADELDGITVTCDGEIWTPAHTHTWGETYTDGGEGGHYKTCTECDGHSATEEHTWGGTPQADGDGGHYLTCTAAGCGARSETVAHEYEYSDGGDTHTMTCADCNHTKSEEHAYGGEEYTDAGHVKTCAGCGHTETAQHAWGETFTSGDNGHYKTCTAARCGAHSETEAHAFGTTYTDNKDGTHYKSCSVCGGQSEAVEHDCEYEDNADGTHTTTCTKCAYSQTEAHRYKDGMCEACGCPDPTKVYVASTGSDTNAGSRAAPFATIQKAVDAVLAANDGTSAYTIYVDGTISATTATYTGAKGMADFTALTKRLTLTIKALSSTATLDGGARFDADGNVTNPGIGKGIIYVKPASGGKLNLTLENLVIKGGKVSNDYGGGIYFNSAGSVLTIKDCEISGNKAIFGGGVYVFNGTFTMDGGEISGNTARDGGGVFMATVGACNKTGGERSGKTADDGGRGVER